MDRWKTQSSSEGVTYRGSTNYVWNPNDQLGFGATGAVCRGRHRKRGDLCAVKIFSLQSHMRPLSVQMREFQVLQKLKHKNIVQLLAVEEDSLTRDKVIVMELCDDSLYGMLCQAHNAYGLEEEELLLLMRHLASGLQHLRHKGIVHRDLKPGNILRAVSEDGSSVYKLTDFGAAKELDEDEQFMSLYGTEEYLHPAMYQKAFMQSPVGTAFDANVDLWSIGVTLYHAATGQLPFRPYGGRHNKQTMYEMISKKEPGVIAGNQDSPDGTVEWTKNLPSHCWISKGLAKHLVPLLAGLMEQNQAYCWTFDMFFNKVEYIVTRKLLHLFSITTYTPVKIYIDSDATIATLQELIAEQTDIPASKQHLLFRNTQLKEIVSDMDTIDEFPRTSRQEPIKVMSTMDDASAAMSHVSLRIPSFPEFSSALHLSHDANMAHTCCGVVHYIHKTVEDLLHAQQHICKTAHLASESLVREFDLVASYYKRFMEGSKDDEMRHQTLKTLVDTMSKMTELWKSGMRTVKQPVSTEKWSTILRTFHGQLKRLVREMSQTKEQKQKVAQNMKTLSGKLSRSDLLKSWTKCPGCKKEDKCQQRLDVISGKVTEISQKFKQQKNMDMSHNERDIHKYDKNKLSEHCTKVASLVHGHCYSNWLSVRKKFLVWSSSFWKLKDNATALEEDVGSLLDGLQNLTREFTKMEAKCAEKLSDIMNIMNPTGRDLQIDTPTSHDSYFKKSMSELRVSMTQLKEDSDSITKILEENALLLKELEEEINA